MALEKQCDAVLAFINTKNVYGVSFAQIPNDLIWGDQQPNEEQFKEKETVIAILTTDGFIQRGINEANYINTTDYFVTYKGKAFMATDSYVERAIRWELERLYKDRELVRIRQEIKLNNFQLKTKGWAFWISIASLITAVIALWVSAKKDEKAVSDRNDGSTHASIIDSSVNPKR